MSLASLPGVGQSGNGSVPSWLCRALARLQLHLLRLSLIPRPHSCLDDVLKVATFQIRDGAGRLGEFAELGTRQVCVGGSGEVGVLTLAYLALAAPPSVVYIPGEDM
jgi:hypothetical protein